MRTGLLRVALLLPFAAEDFVDGGGEGAHAGGLDLGVLDGAADLDDGEAALGLC